MILNINKPKDITSRDVINQLNRKFETPKIGHTGTLDPIATGVLIVCTHEDTKLVDFLQAQDKEYIATIKLGIKTDTADITGNIISKKDYNITKNQIEDVLNSFLGNSIQEVPIYSAIKVNGKKLYEYARNNEQVKLPKKEITIYNIELQSFESDEIIFKVKVSKGTYIRSLIEDICEKLNTVGTMKDLQRTYQGNFSLENSNTLEEVMNNNYKTISKEEILKEYPFEEVTEENSKQIKNGAIIDKDFNTLYKVYKNNDEIIAVYQEYAKDNTKAKPYIMFI